MASFWNVATIFSRPLVVVAKFRISPVAPIGRVRAQTKCILSNHGEFLHAWNKHHGPGEEILPAKTVVTSKFEAILAKRGMFTMFNPFFLCSFETIFVDSSKSLFQTYIVLFLRQLHDPNLHLQQFVDPRKYKKWPIRQPTGERATKVVTLSI